MKKIILVVCFLGFVVMSCDDVKPYEPVYCIYNVYQEGINITDACLDCINGDHANGEIFFEKTAVQCTPE